MQQFFVMASSPDGDNLDLIVQAEDIRQVLPTWANHFEQETSRDVYAIYFIPPVGPTIKALAWEEMPKAEVNTRH